jgi:hypothetical protein
VAAPPTRRTRLASAVNALRRKPATQTEMPTPGAMNDDTPAPPARSAPPAPADTRNFRRMSGILVASILIGVMARWSMTRWHAAPADPTASATLIVTASGERGTYPSIAAALKSAKPGDRIVVQAETWEEVVQVHGDGGLGRDVRLEGHAPGDRPVVWRAPKGREDGQPLLKVTGVAGLQVHGFTLDGQDRARDLVVLSGPCPGVTLEELHLTGFRQSGVALRNCAGEDNRPVTLRRLRVVPTRAAPSALVFESRGEEVNRTVRVLDCRLEGPYDAAVAVSGRTADVELSHNRVFNATNGVSYRRATPAYPVGLRLTSNTFYKIAGAGLHFEAAPPVEGSRVELTRNLFGQTGRLVHVEGFVPEPRQTSARWIWGPGQADGAPRYFRLTFQVDGSSVARAVLDLAADAGFTAWLNGEPVGNGRLEPQRRVQAFDVARRLRPGTNVLAVQATGGKLAGLLGRLTYTCAGSDDVVLASDSTWKASAEAGFAWQQPAFDDSRWSPAAVVASYGQGEASWRNLVWEKVMRDTFGDGKAGTFFPEPSGNCRDADSAEGFPTLKSSVLKFTLPTDPTKDGQFLRYPPGSEPAAAGSPGVPPSEK